jgi:hypothetical protein
MVIAKALEAVWAGLLLSLTTTVKLNVPAIVGVPLIVPPVLRANPDGNIPLMDQV